METFFILYALTISIELLLSLIMAIFLYLIIAPRGGGSAIEPKPVAPTARRPLARSVEGALGDAFASVSEGRDDLSTITNARSLLVRYAYEHQESIPRSG